MSTNKDNGDNDVIVNVRLRKGCVRELRHLLSLHGFKTMTPNQRDAIASALRAVDCKAGCDQQRAHRETSRKQVDALMKEPDEYKREVARWKVKCAQLELDYQEICAIRDRVVKERDDLHNRCDGLRFGRNRAEAECSELKEKVDRLQETQKKALGTRVMQAGILTMLNPRITELKASLREVSEERDALLAQVNEIREESADKDNRIKRLSGQLAGARSDFKMADKEVSRLLAEASELKRQLTDELYANYRFDLEKAKSKVKSIREQVKVAHKRCSELTNEIDSLRTDAKRYRFIRDRLSFRSWTVTWNVRIASKCDAFDSAIDERIGATEYAADTEQTQQRTT